MTAAATSDALRQLLAGLPERVPVESIDRVWLFPVRPIGDHESGLVVLAIRPPADPGGPRRVLTLRYRIGGVGKPAPGVNELTEQGTAPAESVQRVIEGVLRRLGDDAQDPAVHEIGGDPARWTDLLASLAPVPVDPGTGE